MPLHYIFSIFFFFILVKHNVQPQIIYFYIKFNNVYDHTNAYVHHSEIETDANDIYGNNNVYGIPVAAADDDD
jgi:hypothetical protein